MNISDGRLRPTSVEDVTDYHPVHGAVPAKKVNYEMHDGTKSYVVIPRENYTADNVARALNTAADTHEQVMQLRGNSVPISELSQSPWQQE